MKRPIKPKKPKARTHDEKCYSCTGRKQVKEWGDGPYADYEWVECPVCLGSGRQSIEQLTAMDAELYARQLLTYEKEMQRYEVLKTLKISKKQFFALWNYGMERYANERWP